MGKVTTDITLKNATDAINAGRGIIKEQEIRTMTVNAVVDTGVRKLIINETVRQQLGLTLNGKQRVLLHDGTRQAVQETEPVTVCWKNRRSTGTAVVLPNAKEILLGQIPLEDMDLIVNPALQELTGAHGDEVLCLVL